MARYYTMQYYKITFTRATGEEYSVYIKAFNEQDALKIIEDKQLYKKPIDLEGNYNIEVISEAVYKQHNK